MMMLVLQVTYLGIVLSGDPWWGIVLTKHWDCYWVTPNPMSCLPSRESSWIYLLMWIASLYCLSRLQIRYRSTRSYWEEFPSKTSTWLLSSVRYGRTEAAVVVVASSLIQCEHPSSQLYLTSSIIPTIPHITHHPNYTSHHQSSQLYLPSPIIPTIPPIIPTIPHITHHPNYTSHH